MRRGRTQLSKLRLAAIASNNSVIDVTYAGHGQLIDNNNSPPAPSGTMYCTNTPTATTHTRTAGPTNGNATTPTSAPAQSGSAPITDASPAQSSAAEKSRATVESPLSCINAVATNDVARRVTQHQRRAVERASFVRPSGDLLENTHEPDAVARRRRRPGQDRGEPQNGPRVGSTRGASTGSGHARSSHRASGVERAVTGGAALRSRLADRRPGRSWHHETGIAAARSPSVCP